MMRRRTAAQGRASRARQAASRRPDRPPPGHLRPGRPTRQVPHRQRRPTRQAGRRQGSAGPGDRIRRRRRRRMPSKHVGRPGTHQASRTPRGHWAFVALVLLVFATALIVEGYTNGVLGESPQTANLAGSRGPDGPHYLVHGGPVINATGQHPYSYRIQRKTMALTFDDGPDPIWTPKILAILRREHVPATFFVVGAHAASNPSLVRAELAAGDEIGSHTYTHANLASVGWRLPLELTLTQNALSGAAG